MMYAMAAQVLTVLPAGAWDIGNFLKNATTTVKGWGGLLLVLFGTVAVIWGGVLLLKRLMASPQNKGQEAGWGQIALLLIIGGALMIGGFNFLSDIAGGGKKTIEDLGSGRGAAIVQTVEADQLPFGG